MIILGVTGSSGSGKTTFCDILSKKYNIKIIDADKVAKKLSVPGTEYLNAIKEKFGSEIFLEDGTLNRKALSEKIYNNADDLKTLNSLTFKYVVEEIEEILYTLSQNPENSIVAIDAPLLIESGIHKKCDYIISLIAEKNIKIDRICKRDKITENTAIKRLAIQQSDEFYEANSNYIIENNSDKELEEKIDTFLKQLGN